ncbi:YfcE family phosphodiesterase [Virgibacillus dakarensis]|uniref:Phosphoesterase n=1 Tax=Lentibacillus populi TaxID=1827502 RepID=A0A9W5U100_9BACI|nr:MULTISPECIES: metallophosphoesterase family protein [Bacillaceae]MBT2218563.1 metallophosphoesterase [Virgibacillus dakarensis]MTW87176.1 YfcE family phosphodiesterase [Virgibacillus dakarensis]GGB59241.1 phosphoesterase [Lentibacillus populi]
MRIIVMADTHMPSKGKQLPKRLTKELKTADLIIHAGDWNSIEVFQTLTDFGSVKGVYGNVDTKDITDKFPSKEIVNVKGYRIGVIHGHGEKMTTEKRALEAFAGNDVDVIIFGHSHIPLLRYFKKVLLLNPGSPTDKRTLPHYSFAILEIDEEIRADMIFFTDKY